MTSDPEHLETLLTVPTEVEAAAVITALAEYDTEAIAVGGYMSDFKVGIPANVAVVVKRRDLDRAKRALTEIRAGRTEIDWSKADVGEDSESQRPTDEMPSDASNWALNLVRLCWILFLLDVAVSFFIWLFTRDVGLLIRVVVGISIIGLALILPLLAFRRR